jgi:hypothetical protein
VTCPQLKTSSGLSADHVRRYHQARQRWLTESATTTSSSGSAPASTDGLIQSEAASSGTPSTPMSGLGAIGGTDIWERLAALALNAQGPASEDGPPIHSYALRAGVDGGETVVATEEYRAWFCRQYGVPRDEVRRAEERPADSSGERAVQAGSRRGDMTRFRKTP